jgi:hypothetical protein
MGHPDLNAATENLGLWLIQLHAGGGLARRLLAAFDAVVEVAVAGGAEGLVVEADGAGGLVELLGEGVEGAEMVGGGGNLEVGGVEELLVALVEEMGDLAIEQEAGTGDHEDRALVRGLAGRSFGDLGGAAVLTDPKGAGGTSGCGWRTLGGGRNIKSLTAEKGEDVVEALLGFLGHKFQ